MRKFLMGLVVAVMVAAGLTAVTSTPASAKSCGAWFWKYSATTTHNTANFGTFSFRARLHVRDCTGYDQFDDYAIVVERVNGDHNCMASNPGNPDVILANFFGNPDQFDGADLGSKNMGCNPPQYGWTIVWPQVATQSVYSVQTTDDRCLHFNWRLEFPLYGDHTGVTDDVCVSGT